MKSTQQQIVARLTETLTAAESSDWWDSQTADQKKLYIKDHPNSKYAKDAIKEEQEGGHDEALTDAEPHHDEPEHIELDKKTEKARKEVAGNLRNNSSKIAAKLRSTFPRMHNAASGLKALATGKPLEDEHKEALIELGTLALNTGLSKKYGVWHAITISQVGITAVRHGIEHFREKKEQSPHKDDTQVFVEAVADGLEQPVKPIPREEAKSFFKSTFKHAAKHVVQVADKSFSNIKPAVAGIRALSKGQPMDAEHKKAIKELGMFAIGTAITYMPGGVFAHIGASVGVAAVNHAIKVIKKSAEDDTTLVEAFVAATVGSLEDSLLDAVAPE